MPRVMRTFYSPAVPRVKDKIKSLRDYFVKELKKEEGMRQSGYVSPWTHFRSWAFLRPGSSC